MNDSPSKSPALGRLNWREIGALYRHELRCALRDKTILVCGVLLPLIIFPFVLWAAFSGLMFMQGQTRGFVSRIAVREWPKNHKALRDQFGWDERFAIDPATNVPNSRVERGELDAIVEFVPATGPASKLSNNFWARVTFDGSKERSSVANQRINDAVAEYRDRWLRREADDRGLTAAQWRDFGIVTRNAASDREMGAFLMGLMLPILFVVMVSMGCFYPAVDTLAGERERNTWETLMSTAASRINIVAAKYLYVASMGGLAGALNVLAIVVTIKPIMTSLAGPDHLIDFAVPMAAIPVMAAAGVLLAGFIAAVMLILSSFARTFAEGQALITPFYSVIPLPLFFLQIPGLAFSAKLALIPVVNITMMVRAALGGKFPAAPIAITLIESLALIWLCVRLSGFILKFEDFVSGSYSGGIVRFFRGRMKNRKAQSLSIQ